MRLSNLRLAWRMSRWELAFLIGGSLLLSLAAVVVAWQLDVNRDAIVACYDAAGGQTVSASCRSLIELGNLLSSAVGVIGGAVTVAPLAVGIFLGAPLVAREIEHRTAPMAWSLSLSRWEWLVGRTVPVVILIGIALLALGQASELLLRTAEQGELGFRQYGMFGPLIPARGLAVFGIGLVVGLALGRVLPAILVTALATAALMAGLSIGRDLIMREESVWRPMGDQSEVVHMVYDSGFRSDTTGDIITWEQAYNEYPEAFDRMGEGSPSGMTSVWRIVPPERFPLFVAREAGILMALSAVLAVLAVLIVRRRRPT